MFYYKIIFQHENKSFYFKASGLTPKTLLFGQFSVESQKTDLEPIASGKTSKVFKHKGDSGKSVRRSFCSNCGSPYMVEYEVTPDFRVIMAGTLDDKTLIKPEWNIYTDSKQGWLELSPHLKNFDRGFKRN